MKSQTTWNSSRSSVFFTRMYLITTLVFALLSLYPSLFKIFPQRIFSPTQLALVTISIITFSFLKLRFRNPLFFNYDDKSPFKMLNTRSKLSIFILLMCEVIARLDAAILTPPYFNLVANKRVTATATCGEGVREPELYCKLTGSSATDRETSSYANLIQGQYCEYCDPNDPEKNHHANYSIDGTDKWWQSPPLSRSLDFNQVNLTIDFGQVSRLIRPKSTRRVN